MKICFLSGFKQIVEQDEIEFEFTGKVSALLEALCGRFGDNFRHRLMGTDSEGKRNPFVKILVDGKDIKQEDPILEGEETLFIFLPIAGG